MSTFDVNILEDVYSEPHINLTFPLPTDEETYVTLSGNGKTSNSFRLLENFLSLVTGMDTDKIYSNNEYKYTIRKYSKDFKKKFDAYMDDKLTRSDDKLTEIVYDLINHELRLKLIKPEDFNIRFVKIKQFMVDYYKLQNKNNLPTFESELGLKIAYITVTKLFLKIYPNGIWVSKNDFESLFKQYLKNPMSIIYLPNHQSHVDYIIFHVITVRFQMAVPTVIAGENLNVAVFGKLLKNLGAIFIPRSFNNDLYTERNLNNVIEFFLTNNVAQEVFIEGTRSRDGKLLLPKYGILKSYASIYNNQKSTNPKFDMLFQPVSITYERIYEADSFIDELIGKDKIKESFFGILSNGIKTLNGDKNEKPYILDKDGFNDNSTRELTGKLYIKLGKKFTFSEFIEHDTNLFIDNEVNLKKLGFRIMHEINNTKFIPNAGVVGTALQLYYYFNFKNSKQTQIFSIIDFIPTLKLVITILHREIETDPINATEFKRLLGLNDSQLIDLTIGSIKPFFRYITVNESLKQIKVSNSIELLYYKNLTIHLIIERCLICTIVLLLSNNNDASFDLINSIYYILTGLLKVEFLFDYNNNARSQESFILQDLVELKVLLLEKGNYKVIDYDYVYKLRNLTVPFLQSYINLIQNILDFKPPTKIKQVVDKKTKKLLPIDNNELKYPTTKTLLKFTISNSQAESVESFNKQYLLSDLYYLNHLKLIQIFKNQAKTKAFVKVLNLKDLNVLKTFLTKIVDNDLKIENKIKLNYVADIINKNFDRLEAPKL